MVLQNFLRPNCMNLSWKTARDLVCACDFSRDNVFPSPQDQFKSGNFLNVTFSGVGLFPVHSFTKNKNSFMQTPIRLQLRVKSLGFPPLPVHHLAVETETEEELESALKQNQLDCFLPLRISYFTLYLMSEDLLVFASPAMHTSFYSAYLVF